MVIGTYISIITLNVNGLNAPTKRHRFAEWLQKKTQGFPGGAVVENLPVNAGNMGSSPGLGRSHMPWSN